MKTLKLFFLSTVFLISLFVVPIASAVPDLRSQIQINTQAGVNQSGLGNAGPQEVGARVIKIFLTTVGIIFTALMVISGYNILTAAGDEGKVEKAKKTITAAIIGMTITLGAYGITKFLGEAAIQVTSEAPANTTDYSDTRREGIIQFFGGQDDDGVYSDGSSSL